MNTTNFVGHVVQRIEGCEIGSELVQMLVGPYQFTMQHVNDCCESVCIQQIDGDINDLIGLPLLEAEEVSNSDDPPEGSESHTWTFYKFGTIKGRVTIRWLGESNGYYSEAVSTNITKLDVGQYEAALRGQWTPFERY